MSSSRPLSSAELHEVLSLLRAGGTVQVGGSRAHTTWGWDQGWYRADFDEGREERFAASEADVAAAVRANPNLGRDLLWADARRALGPAVRAGDELGVRRVLARCATLRDPSVDDALLVALLAPQASLDDDERAALREHVRGFTFYHLVLGALGWARTPEDGRVALDLLDRASRLVGDPVPDGMERLRAAFQKLIGGDG